MSCSAVIVRHEGASRGLGRAVVVREGLLKEARFKSTLGCWLRVELGPTENLNEGSDWE